MDGFNCETTKCFVPEMLVSFIDLNVANGKDGLEPSSFFLNGVCLLVDISGFTKLSCDFCGLGKSGIDELQLATNGYMGKLVEIIYTYGGEIIKFAGDAIICVFAVRSITSVSTHENMAGFTPRSVINFQELLIPQCSEPATVPSSPSSTTWRSAQRRESSTNISNNRNKNKIITADVIIRAMLCAEKLRREQTNKLSVHVAMSCGEMCFGVLGGVENRWECLISGPCIHELSDCLDDASSKEAVISRDCADILAASMGLIDLEERTKDTMNFRNEEKSCRCTYIVDTIIGNYQFELEQLPSGNHRLVYIRNAYGDVTNNDNTTTSVTFSAHNIVIQYPQSLKLIRQFVPLPIAEEIEAGTGLAFIAEIRKVTTMFMKWDSYDPAGKHRDLRELQQCFFCTQEILHSTGAYLRQFLVDDKGCVLIACWGMPNLSYLDNASRGLSAAAEIHRELNKLDMSCSFGITTGDVYCGTVGSAVRMEYAAIGNVVNMAARLMGKANGGILIDDVTYSHLPGKWKELVTALDPIKVKGRDEPLQVYSYVCLGFIRVKEKVVPDHEIPVACREALLKLLCDISATRSLSPAPGVRLKQRQSSMASVPQWIAAAVEATVQLGGQLHSSGNTMKLVLIKGKKGSGRSTVVKWLRTQAEERHIPMHAVRLGSKNMRSDFTLCQCLFQLLTPRDIYVSRTIQCDFIRTLLENICPGGISSDAAQVAFSVLHSNFGITCTFTNILSGDHVKPPHSQLLSNENSYKNRILTHTQSFGALFKIFNYLLNLKTCLVVLENMEHCDECCLKMLMELTELDTTSVLVLTAIDEMPGDLERTSSCNHMFASTDSYKQGTFHSTAWNREYRSLIQSLPNIQTITLENYSAEEIDKLLCETLGVASVPPEVALLVRDFSGESNFWVRELLQFITEHGAEQFLAAVGEKETTARNMYTSIDDVYSQHARSRHMISPANSSSNLSSKPLPTSGRKLSHHASRMRTPASVCAAGSPHQQQLEKLVLCRFGALLPDAQLVLRTASIIGMTFSSTVLYGVLSPQLRELLADSMQILLNQKWLYQDTENEAQFQFAHTYAHVLIYDLTPSSERRRIHHLVADFMENQYSQDKSIYGLLSYHYQQCVPAKALMYAAKSMDTLLQVTTIFDYSDCLDLLTGTVPCCETTWDVRMLLKMVNRARVSVREFELGSRRAEGQSWLSRVYAMLAVFGRSPNAVLPESAVKAKYRFRSDDVSDTLPVRTNSFSWDASNDSQSDAEDLGYQKRTKRMMLQQLSRLFNQLSEQLACLAEEREETGKGVESGMRDWQEQFLEGTEE